MKVFCFTGTGNSLFVAKSLGGEVTDICRTVGMKGEAEDDAIGFVFPVHWGDAPEPMIRFLESARLKSPYFFAVGTYGYLPAGAMRRFAVKAENCGIRLHYCASIRMLDNNLSLYDMAKEKQKMVARPVEENVRKIRAEIEARTSRPARRNVLMQAVSAVEQWSDHGNVCRKFTVSEQCVTCGICAGVCPTGNVEIVSRHPLFGNKCVSCMSCIQLCPQGAIHLKGERSAERWHHPQTNIWDLSRK